MAGSNSRAVVPIGQSSKAILMTAICPSYANLNGKMALFPKHNRQIPLPALAKPRVLVIKALVDRQQGTYFILLNLKDIFILELKD